jgi:ankyrin repeat protein
MKPFYRFFVRHGAGASITERNKNGSTMLHDISSSGNEGIVRLLVDRLVELNADLDTLDNGQRTALYLAATNGHSAVVAILLPQVLIVLADQSHHLLPLKPEAYGHYEQRQSGVTKK